VVRSTAVRGWRGNASPTKVVWFCESLKECSFVHLPLIQERTTTVHLTPTPTPTP